MGMDKVIEPKKGIKKKHIIWGSGVSLILLLIFRIAFGDNSSVLKVEQDKLSIDLVEVGMFSDYISVTGQVEPISTIYLDAAEGGRVSEILIEEGTMVNKDDIILRLENRQLYQTILESESMLAVKENDLRNTRVSFETEQLQSKRNILEGDYNLTRKKRTFEQNEFFYGQKFISKEEYIQSKEDYEYQLKLQELNKLKSGNDSLLRITSMSMLETDLEKMRLMLQFVHQRLEDLNVKAPVDGQLGMLDAELGQSIGSGQRIGQINVLTDFKVNASIDEHYIDRISRGLTGTINRNGTEYKINVRKVYPEVRDGQFKIDMVFDGVGPDNIRTGQTYQVRLELGESGRAIMVSRGGFFQSTGGQWIFVLNDDETEAVKRNIKIGKQNPQFYEITDGLIAGEKVITSGYELFGDADKLVLK